MRFRPRGARRLSGAAIEVYGLVVPTVAGLLLSLIVSEGAGPGMAKSVAAVAFGVSLVCIALLPSFRRPRHVFIITATHVAALGFIVGVVITELIGGMTLLWGGLLYAAAWSFGVLISAVWRRMRS